MTFSREDNPRRQGDSGLGIAISYFACAGYTVCVPLTDSQTFDLIVVKRGKMERVAVRTTTRFSHGYPTVGLRTQGGNKSQFKVQHFQAEAVELLFVACVNGENYLIPSQEVKCRAQLTLNGRMKPFLCGSGVNSSTQVFQT